MTNALVKPLFERIRLSVAQLKRLEITASHGVFYSFSTDMALEAATELEQLHGDLSLAEEGLANYALEVEGLRSDFKNFHRLLCERFGYGHDEHDWHRDQLSLIEWIAKRHAHEPCEVRCNYVGMYDVQCGLHAGHQGQHRMFGPLRPGAGTRESFLQRTIDRHARWRETALGFLRQVVDGRGTEDEWPALAEFIEQSDSRVVAGLTGEALGVAPLGSAGSTPAQRLTPSSLDSLIAEADKYILPVDVKMGAATFRKGVKVGTMLRGLKTHAEREIADAWRERTAASAGEPHGDEPCHPDANCSVCSPQRT